MKWFVDRITEASTHGGLTGVVLSINQILQHNYGVGIPALITSLCAVFIPEKKSQ